MWNRHSTIPIVRGFYTVTFPYSVEAYSHLMTCDKICTALSAPIHLCHHSIPSVLTFVTSLRSPLPSQARSLLLVSSFVCWIKAKLNCPRCSWTILRQNSHCPKDWSIVLIYIISFQMQVLHIIINVVKVEMLNKLFCFHIFYSPKSPQKCYRFKENARVH